MCATLCNLCAILSFGDFLFAMVISEILLQLKAHDLLSLSSELCFLIPAICYGITWLIIISAITLIERKYPELMETINGFFTEGD